MTKKSFRKMSDTDLQKTIKELIVDLKSTFGRVAEAVKEADRRGMKLAIAPDIIATARKVNSGRLSINAVFRFGGRPQLLERIAVMPAEEQEELLKKTDDEVRDTIRIKKSTRRSMSWKDKFFELEGENKQLKATIKQLELRCQAAEKLVGQFAKKKAV